MSCCVSAAPAAAAPRTATSATAHTRTPPHRSLRISVPPCATRAARGSSLDDPLPYSQRGTSVKSSVRGGTCESLFTAEDAEARRGACAFLCEPLRTLCGESLSAPPYLRTTWED